MNIALSGDPGPSFVWLFLYVNDKYLYVKLVYNKETAKKIFLKLKRTKNRFDSIGVFRNNINNDSWVSLNIFSIFWLLFLTKLVEDTLGPVHLYTSSAAS